MQRLSDYLLHGGPKELWQFSSADDITPLSSQIRGDIQLTDNDQAVLYCLLDN